MTAISSHPHRFAWLESTPTGSILSSAKTKTIRRTTPSANEMPASLWRHSQNEDATQARHHQVADRLLMGFAGFSLAGIVYAFCQTGTLMSGNRLHDAVAAFLR